MTEASFTAYVNFRDPHPGYVGHCLDILQSQTHEAWEAFVCDDASVGYGPLMEVIERARVDRRINVRRNALRLGIVRNSLDSLDMANGTIAIQIDGDDWLMNDHALEIIARKYEAGHDMTWGALTQDNADANMVWSGTPPGMPLEQAEIVAPRTFGMELYREALQRWGKDAFYLCQESGDIAVVYPLLRLSRNPCRIDTPLYFVNRIHGKHDSPTNRDDVLNYVKRLP